MKKWLEKTPISKKEVFKILLGSMAVTLSVGISCLFCLPLFLKMWKEKEAPIQKIAVISRSVETIPIAYFSQLLGLSSDQPLSFRDFSVKKAEASLEKTGLFKKIKATLIKKDTVFIDYALRTPIALCAEKENTALDEEGMFFPLFPFYTPKKLPLVTIGFDSEKKKWGESLAEDKRILIGNLLSAFPDEKVEEIDLSQSQALTLGKREIVAVLSKEGYTHTLRLTPRNYQEQIPHYHRLSREILKDHKQSVVIDLRLTQVAFFTDEEK